MDIKKVIRERYSVRNFTGQPVAIEVMNEILEMTSLAPSAVNFQPWHFIIITAKEKLEALGPVYHRKWIQSAPVVIVACVNHLESWKRSSDGHDFGEVDVAIAVDHLTLAATSLGLGSCWVCNFDVTACRTVLNLPEHLEPLALIPLGYPAGDPPVKKRKTVEEIVSWEEYGGK